MNDKYIITETVKGFIEQNKEDLLPLGKKIIFSFFYDYINALNPTHEIHELIVRLSNIYTYDYVKTLLIDEIIEQENLKVNKLGRKLGVCVGKSFYPDLSFFYKDF